MKKKDLILITIIFSVALISFGAISLIERLSGAEDGVAVVYHERTEILRIDLRDGSYEIIDEEFVYTDHELFDEHTYIVRGMKGSNQDHRLYHDGYYVVKIQYRDHKVHVEDEESPQNICQHQGATNSPLRPLTCLPNQVVITIETGIFDPDDDDIIIE